MDESLDEEEVAQRLAQLVGTAALPEEKYNVHTFLAKVAGSEDTTKLGFLTEEEIGLPKLPQRTYKELALFCSDVANMGYFGNYFAKKAEILTSTSLSRTGFLTKLAVLQRREIGDVTKKPKKNKGWFAPKEPKEPEM